MQERAARIQPLPTPNKSSPAPATLAPRYIPNYARTPGAINPAVTQAYIRGAVCVPGWRKTVRPSTACTEELKKRQMCELGLPGTPQDYHEDHLVPHCVGGHPSDPRNLWPQPVGCEWTDKVKDQLEGSVCWQLCRGDTTLKDGHAIFLPPDWTHEYVREVLRIEVGVMAKLPLCEI